MKCLLCDNQTKKISNKYCSVACSSKARVGRPRPDVTLRNKTNNPIWNPEAKKKMSQALMGRVQTDREKIKRATSLKKYYETNPEAKQRLAKNVWEKYTSKIAGTGWRKIRTKALERDGYKCTMCGEDTYRLLVVHHIDWQGKRRGVPAKDWNNNMSNLQTLCHKCHNGIHRHKSLDYNERASNI